MTKLKDILKNGRVKEKTCKLDSYTSSTTRHLVYNLAPLIISDGVNHKKKVLKLACYIYVDEYNHESWNGNLMN